jgi:AhpC/TSA family
MRRVILVSVLVLLLAAAYRSMGSPTAVGSRVSPTLPGPAPNAGDPAPTFAHERYDGGTFSLTEQGIYVLTFWDTLNRDSNQAQPYFAQLAQDYEGSGVRFAAIYIGDLPKDAGHLPYSVVVDDTGSLAANYNVKRVPRIFIISDGRVYVVQNDFLPVNYDLLRGALEELVPLESEPGNADG